MYRPASRVFYLREFFASIRIRSRIVGRLTRRLNCTGFITDLISFRRLPTFLPFSFSFDELFSNEQAIFRIKPSRSTMYGRRYNITILFDLSLPSFLLRLDSLDSLSSSKFRIIFCTLIYYASIWQIHSSTNDDSPTVLVLSV